MVLYSSLVTFLISWNLERLCFLALERLSLWPPMTERRMSITQARNLLRALTERNQAQFLRLGEKILNRSGDALMAPINSPLTFRILEYFRERSSGHDPRIRLFIFENVDEIGAFVPSSPSEGEEQEKSLEHRAKEIASDVGQKADEVAATARSVASIASGFKLKPDHRKRADIQATLKEMERALRSFRRSTQIAMDEYLGNRNPLVLDLIKDHELDAESARHGLHVACFATELSAHLTSESYFGKSTPDEMYQLAGVPEDDRLYSPEAIEKLREDLFRQELVEIFLGGFLHDAGLWSTAIYQGHEERGALVVSEVARLGDLADSLVDIILLHSNLENLATHEGAIRTRTVEGDEVSFTADFYSSPEAAEEFLLLRSEDSKLLGEEDLRKIIPVAVAEFFVTATEDRSPRPAREVIGEAVALSETTLYGRFMMTLCNSQPEVEAPPRSLVAFDGRVSVGAIGKKHLMELDGDVGICVHNVGWYAPHVIRILKKGADGGLQNLERIQAGHPDLTERSKMDGFMYVPVGRVGNLSITVVGILGKEAFRRNFKEFADWVEEEVD